jgi:uncharacterized membrane protein
MGTFMIKTLLIIALGTFFVIAGLNHFLNPGFYYPLIPEYLPFHVAINYGSGILEIILGIGVFISNFRQKAGWGIITLLLLFIPSHVYFIQIGSCVDEGLCVPAWLAWIRLLLIHPLLIIWAYLVSKS